MKIEYVGIEVEVNQELKIQRNGTGLIVNISFKSDNRTEIFYNVNDIRLMYKTSFSQILKVCIESKIHRTSCTYIMQSISKISIDTIDKVNNRFNKILVYKEIEL